MEFIITNAGFSAIQNAQIQGIELQITQYQVGSDYNYNPTPSMTGLQGTLLYSGGVGGFEVVSPSVIQYDVVMGPSVGTFEFGEVALLLADGTVFALASLPVLQSKRAATLTTSGDTIVIQAQIVVTNASTSFTFQLVTNSEAQLPALGTVDALVPPGSAIANAFLCAQQDDVGNPVLALEDTKARWRFTTHQYPILVDLPNIAAAANSVTVSVTLEQLKLGGPTPTGFNFGEYLISFTSGLNDGYVRLVSAIALANTNQVTFTFDQPLPQAPAVGDTFTLFRSNASILQTVVDAEAYSGLEIDLLAGSAPQWAFITNLPAANDTTNFVKVMVVLFGGTRWASTDMQENTFGIGSAGGLNVNWMQYGTGHTTDFRLQVYLNSDSTYSVYAYMQAPTNNMVGGVGAKILSGSLFDDILIPSYSPTQPSGTLAYDSLNFTPLFAVDGNGNISGTSLALTTNGSSRTLSISDSGVNGANIFLTGNSSSSVNKGVTQKYVRAYQGNLQVLNNAYSSVILNLDDSGNLTVNGMLTAGGGNFTGPVSANNGLTASSLSVSQTATINSLNVQGNLQVGGSLSVTGSASLGNSTIQNLTALNTNVNGLLEVTGSTNIQGEIANKTSGFNGTGLNIGWNFTNGQGEVDLLLGPQGGSGGLNIYQLNSSGAMISTTPLLALSSSGTLSLSGGLSTASSNIAGNLQVGGTSNLGNVSANSLTANYITANGSLTVNGEAIANGLQLANYGAISFTGGNTLLYEDSSGSGPNDFVVRTGGGPNYNYTVMYANGGMYVPGPITCSPAGTNSQAVNLGQLQNGTLSPVFGRTQVQAAQTSVQAVNLGQLQSILATVIGENGSVAFSGSTTLSASNAGQTIFYTGSGAATFILPYSNSAAGYKIPLIFSNQGTGPLTINPPSGNGTDLSPNVLYPGQTCAVSNDGGTDWHHFWSDAGSYQPYTVGYANTGNDAVALGQLNNASIAPSFNGVYNPNTGSFLYNLGSNDGTNNVVLRSDGSDVHIYPWGVPYGDLWFGQSKGYNVNFNGNLTANGSVTVKGGLTAGAISFTDGSGTQIYEDNSGSGPGDFVVRTYDGTYYYSVFYSDGNFGVPGQVFCSQAQQGNAAVTLDQIPSLIPQLFSSINNVTGSRGFGGYYTNTTGKPMWVTVTGHLPFESQGFSMAAYVDGTQVGYISTDIGGGTNYYEGNYRTLTFIVPNGSGYQVNQSNMALQNWVEIS